MKKVKYVQLESQAFLSDVDFQQMTASQKGAYCAIIFYLYSNNGQCKYDPRLLKHLTGCKNFVQVWKKIGKKFRIKNDTIKHKRVSAELARAKKFIQHQSRAGLASARKRRSLTGGGATAAQPSKRNVIEVNESKDIRTRKTIPSCNSPVSSSPLRPDSSIAVDYMNFYDALVGILKPRNASDRTAFRNIGNWMMLQVHSGQHTKRLFDRVLEFAAEAAKGKSRNPAAVFTSILKKELGYRSDK